MSFDDNGNDGDLEKTERLLRRDRDSITVPGRLDAGVLSLSADRPRAGIAPAILRMSFVLTLAAVILTGYSISTRSGLENECRKVYASMVEAAEQKDVDKSVSFFDLKAMGVSEDKFRRNISDFYDGFDRIKYDIKDLKVKAKGSDVFARSRYEFRATGGKGRLEYNGSDRIYFRKDGGKLKITCWIAEK